MMTAKPWGPLALLSANRRLDALAKSGRIEEARHLFDGMPERDDYSWNTMLSAYTRHARPRDAFLLFRRLLCSGPRPDPFSISAALRSPAPPALPLLHALALKSALHLDPFVAAALVACYSELGDLSNARQVFDNVPVENRGNRVLWTAVVAAEAQNRNESGALERFRRMRAEGLEPNRFTLPSVLAACAAERALELGRQAHALAVRAGLDGSAFVRSALVGVYASCDDLASARRVLDTADSDDAVSWNTLIVRCSRGGFHNDALSLFAEKRQRGLDVDEFALPSALNSAALVRDPHTGRLVHGLALKSGLAGHKHVGNALVDMYAKCGELGLARAAFDEMPERDVVGWTALLTGLARHESYDAALRLYCEMRAAGVDSDEFITAGVLSSCAELTLLELGRQVHASSVKRRFDSFSSVGNSLVSMYAKSGCVDDAYTVFSSMARRDGITWTALIVGYAQNGRGKDSVQVYEQMVRSGIKPDYVTFIGLLFACSHAGLVDSGRAHFASMERVYKIPPGPEHYACMIDLLGRAGRVGEAAALLDRMKAEPDAAVWKALLAACRVHRHVALAERAAESLFAVDPTDPVPYVLLSNIYSRDGRWSDVARIRALMRSRGVGKKEPGCSWIEAAGVVHVFHVEDRGHPRAAEIYSKVGEMMGRIRERGYAPETGWALQDVGEEGRETGLAYHSEKLAVAFGLLSAPERAPIRVFKNLRVCGDCHTALKLAAKVYGRVIVLRDANCFHHMSVEGTCSCGDYW